MTFKVTVGFRQQFASLLSSVNLQRFLACLCIAVLLLLAVAPAGQGILFATLTAIFVLELALLCGLLRESDSASNLQLFVYNSPIGPRAPPAL